MTPEIIVPFLEARGLQVINLDIYSNTMALTFNSATDSINACIELRKHDVKVMPFKSQLKISIS